ncbi:hypothetical protein LguiB_005055 [Lonicera macranthoides]
MGTLGMINAQRLFLQLRRKSLRNEDCGVDSGEYVFMNPRVYLNQSNALDEMKDSPGESSEEDDDDDLDGSPPKRKEGDNGLSFRLVADSIQKFGEIYEKIEDNKRQQMMELEKMRMDFHRDLELQKSLILERAQAEIAKIRQGVANGSTKKSNSHVL